MYVRTRLNYPMTRRGRGLGAAPCPSLQQLQGIVDPNDPCQSFSPTGDTFGGNPEGPVLPVGVALDPRLAPAAAKPTCMPGDAAQLQNGYWICVPQTGGSGMFAWLKANPMAGLGLGAGVLFLVGASMKGGRR
jgi:hypothetical protein